MEQVKNKIKGEKEKNNTVKDIEIKKETNPQEINKEENTLSNEEIQAYKISRQKKSNSMSDTPRYARPDAQEITTKEKQQKSSATDIISIMNLRAYFQISNLLNNFFYFLRLFTSRV
jgi:hypothetical protein